MYYRNRIGFLYSYATRTRARVMTKLPSLIPTVIRAALAHVYEALPPTARNRIGFFHTLLP